MTDVAFWAVILIAALFGAVLAALSSGKSRFQRRVSRERSLMVDESTVSELDFEYCDSTEIGRRMP